MAPDSERGADSFSAERSAPRRSAPLTRRAAEAVALITIVAIFVFIGTTLTHMQGFLTNERRPLFGDFLAFFSAGKLVLMGKVAQVHNPHLVHRVQVTLIPHLHVLLPWNSPPQFLLIAVLLAFLPYPVAAIGFLTVSGSVYFIAARKLLPDTRAMIFAASLPAAVYELGSIQTGILIAGITGLALFFQDKRPLTAGALLGVLTIKPHLAILWPLYLAFTGRWRMFAAAAASCVAVTLIAGLVFGFDSYARFFANLDYVQKLITNRYVHPAAYASLYGNLLGLGAHKQLALSAQAISAMLALGLTALVWRRGDGRRQGAALCATTMLTSPYLFFYDATLLGVGAALLGPPRSWRDWPALALGWGAGLSIALSFVLQSLHLPAYLPLVPAASWVVLLTAAARAGVFSSDGPVK